MRKTLLVLGIFLALIMVVPAFGDLTGYIQAPYGTSWTRSFATSWRRSILDDGSFHWWRFFYVNNVGPYRLTEAKARIWVYCISYGGNTYYDAATVDSNLVISNAEKIGPKTYLIDLGTIPVGHSKRMLLNVWNSRSMGFTFYMSVWYLP